MVRVLITGASGFIGSNLVRACLRRGDEVSVITRPQSSLEHLTGIKARINVNRLQVTDADAVGKCLADARPDIIFHVGARTRFDEGNGLRDVAESIQENITPLVVLLTAAANCGFPPKVFVRTGSIAEYGDIATPYTETARENPRGTYGASLLAGTHYMTMAQPRLPFHAVTVRLALTYGPRQSSSFLIPHLISSLLEQRPVTIRNPLDRRDLIHVDDVTRALLLIADNPEAAGGLVNVATGVAPTVAEVTRLLLDATGAASDLVEYGPADHEPSELICSCEQIRLNLGWKAEIDLPDGLERTVQWARENRAPTTVKYAAAARA